MIYIDRNMIFKRFIVTVLLYLLNLLYFVYKFINLIILFECKISISVHNSFK